MTVRRTLLIGLVLCLAIAAGCQQAPSADTPEGSAMLLAEAAEGADWTGMRTYMDAEAVGLVFAESLLATLPGQDSSPGAAASPDMHGDGFPSGAMQETFARQFVETLQAAAEDGTVVAEGTLLGTLLEDGVGEIEYVGDDEALVSVTVPAEGGDQTVQLRMRRTGQRWMLVAVQGTTDLYEIFF